MNKVISRIPKWLVLSALVFGAWLLSAQAAVVNKPIPRYESSLSIAIDNVSTSTLTFANGKDNDGNSLSGPMCFTIDSGVANSVEDVCGTASGTVISNLTRGMAADGVSSNASDAHAHRVGADVKITDSPYLQQYYRFLNGTDAFPTPLNYAASVSTSSFSNSQQLTDKAYVDGVAIAGGVVGTSSQPGIVLIATGTQLANGLASSPYTSVAPSQLFSATASTSVHYQVPVAVNGKVDSNYITFPVSGNPLTTGNTPTVLGVSALTSSTFAFSGASTTFIVPATVSSITINVQGAGGTDGTGGSGGTGASVTGTLAVTPGQTYYVFVGGSASFYNGGGANAGSAGAGGGATCLANSGVETSADVILCAGGGGGGGSGTTGLNADSGSYNGAFLAGTTSDGTLGGGGGGFLSGNLKNGGLSFASSTLTSTSTSATGAAHTVNGSMKITYTVAPSLTGTNYAGKVAAATNMTTSTITFNSAAFVNGASCGVEPNNATNTSWISYNATTSFNVTFQNALTSNQTFNYWCLGY